MSDDRPRPVVNPAGRARRIGGRVALPGAGGSSDVGDVGTADGDPDLDVITTSNPASNAASNAASNPAASPVEPVRPGDAPAPRRAVPLRWIPAGALGLTAVALVVLVAIASHGVYWGRSDASAGARNARQEQALAAAKQCFAQINTYDYRKLSGLADVDAACTTGAFSATVRKAVTSQIVAYAPKEKAVQTAQINRAGIVSVSGDGTQVVTLIYGQLVQTNASTAKNGRTDVFGALVTVTKLGGSWRISQVGSDVGTTSGS